MTRSTASLKDVAVLAGVSVKTVSNVVNDFPHVAPPTRARVREAIEQLGYRPNLAARSLRAGRSGLVALAVPELTIPYFAELASLVVEAAAVRGVTVLVEQTAASRERERRFVSGRRPQLVDGLISAPLSLPRAELVRRDDRVPLVLVGESVHDAAVDQIGIDSVRAGRAATEHLLGLGRRRIAAIGAPRGRLRTAAHMRRLRGYREALEVAGIAPDPRLAPEIRATHPTEGDRAMAELLRDNEAPDAVFCFNDLLAIGATRRLLARGLRVPEDVAIVGFDDVAEARYLTPALTTIAPDKAQIATLAVDRVLSRLDGAQVETPRRTEVPFELVVRESTRGREPGA